MKVHFKIELVRELPSEHRGHVLEVADTLLSVLPPLPQPESTVYMWVVWPKDQPGFNAPIDSLPSPVPFSFVGPDPSDARVYDYAWYVFDRYRSVRWRLDDPELSVWFDDSVFSTPYRREIMRGFRRWEGILGPGKPRFREIMSRDDAAFHVVSQFSTGAFPRTDDEASRLFHVVIDLPLSLSEPAPPENFFAPAVHEMGHGLGLWAHSPYVGDVMSNFGDESLPSERDVASLKHLYAQPTDLTD